jgi:predicted ATPase
MESQTACHGCCGDRADRGVRRGRERVLEISGRLVDKSLVVAEAGRYRLLETIREYAGDRLRDADEERPARDLQLDFFLTQAESAEPLLGVDRDKWRSVIEPDRENYRAALEHGLAQEDLSSSDALVIRRVRASGFLALLIAFTCSRRWRS